MYSFDTLPLSDSFMFGEVMRNETICKLFLEELLHCKIAKIEFIQKEADLKDTLDAHGIRLDIYLADANNTHYNIEMQNKKDDLEKRSRYYQSGIDRHLLEAGESYKKLPDSYIIFICNYDHLGLGKALYVPETKYRGTDRVYDDGSHVLILNARYTDRDGISTAIAEYLDYIRDADDTRTFTTPLGQLAKNLTCKVRHDSGKRGIYMTLYDKIQEEREEAMAEGLAEGIAKGLAEGVAKGLAEGKAKGLAEGLAEGIAKSIQMLKGLCLSKDVAVTQIAKTYNLSQEEAEEKVNLYW